MRSLYATVAAFLRALILTRSALFFENAALRQQLAVLQHLARRPRLKTSDRVFWVLLSRLWSRWRSVLVIVQPRTVIGWHREGWRLFWKWTSRGGRPVIEREHRALIRRLSLENPGGGEDRIRDELRLKLGVDHSASTVRRYMLRPEQRGPLGQRSRSQTGRTFLENHAREIYACDFVTQWTAAFRVVYIFVVMELGTRRIVHANVTSSPTLAWVKQQLRDLFAFDSGPRFLIHDNDGMFGQLGRRGRGKRRFRCHLDRWLSKVLGVRGISTPYGAPNANAFLEDSTPTCGAKRSITSCFSRSDMCCAWSAST
jgi:putative transposase